MPNRHHYTVVARELKRRLNGKAFETIARTDITDLLRTVSGEETTRIKSNIAGDLGHALLEQGVRCYPSLENTTTGDSVRLFHAGTVLGELVDLIVHPTAETDRYLGNILTKVKGQWLDRPAEDPASISPKRR